MLKKLFQLSTVAAFGALLLAGCASTQRTQQTDENIKTVAVVSLLQENAPMVRLGLTVFNNDATTLPQGGALNRIALGTIETRLRAARPAWVIKDSGADPVALGDKLRKGGMSFGGGFTSNVKEDLVAITRKTGADALFVIVDTTSENAPGRGVGMVLRALPGLSPRAILHSRVLLILVDKNGNEVTNRNASIEVSKPASELALTGDLDSLDRADNRAKISQLLQQQLPVGLNAAAGYLGY